MRNISKIYEYARNVLFSNYNSGIYEIKQKKLKKQIKSEYTEYKRQATEGSIPFVSKKHVLLILISIVIIALIVIFLVIQITNEQSYNQTAIITSDSTDSTTIPSEPSEPIKNIETDNLTFESDTSESETNEYIVTNEPITETISSEPVNLPTTEIEDLVESYNGYKIGDLVCYSGTVHYVSSITNQLSGACRGGTAIISGINPDGIHKFHLVAADDDCTVYGWVDEEFIKPAESE